MKAREVINRYKAGERDFRRAILRGQSFQGQDLSGADFSEADIRGTNFTNARLQGANFTQTKAGVQRRWVLIQLMLLLVIAALAGVLQGYFGYFVTYYFPRWWDSGYNRDYFAQDLAVTVAYLITIVVTFIAIARQGFTSRAFGSVAVAGAGASAVAVAVAGAGAGAGASAGASAVASAVAGAGTGAAAAAGTGAVAVAVAVAAAAAGTVAVAGTVAADVAVAVAAAAAVAVASLVLGLYCSHQAFKGNEKFALIRSFGVAFAALGGTRFYKADLSHANFNQAMLKSTNFREANLTHVCWQDAQKLDRARVGDSILSNPAVRDLLVTRNGYKKSYVDANLRGANLAGVNLEAANLKGADLSRARLHTANLKDANLREVLAIGTDFTAAYLTGACLEAWNIDSTTTLTDVDCQYVFLLEQPNPLGSRERRPHEPDQVFAQGDFGKLYTKLRDVVQVLLRNGMQNQAAFREAFQALMDEHPEISPDAIQSIERKGNDALVTLEVPETADKAEISRSLRSAHERVQQLEAKVEELHELRAADLKQVALAQKAQFFNQLVGGNAMNESSDQSRNINVGGDLNLSGSTLNLGEISGNVSNTINQLQNTPTPTATELADLLKQLQETIESDSDLSDPDKTEALEQVGTLAKAGQNPQDGTLKKLANTAVKVLKGTVSALPDTAKLAESCAKLLPLITTLLGI